MRFDAVFEDIPRISVPYGYTSDRLHATAAYDFGRSPGRRLPVRADGPHVPGDGAHDAEHRVRSRGVRPSGLGRAARDVERCSRDFDTTTSRGGEHASFLTRARPRTSALRRYDQAAAKGLDQAQGDDRYGASRSLPGGTARWRSRTSRPGRVQGPEPRPARGENEAFTADADYTPPSASASSRSTPGRTSGACSGAARAPPRCPRTRSTTGRRTSATRWTLRRRRHGRAGQGAPGPHRERELPAGGRKQRPGEPPGGTPEVAAFRHRLLRRHQVVTLDAELGYNCTAGGGGWPRSRVRGLEIGTQRASARASS